MHAHPSPAAGLPADGLPADDSGGRRRVRIRVAGPRSGHGLAAYAWTLAAELGLGGFVCEAPAELTAEVDGPAPAVERFVALFGRRGRELATDAGVQVGDVPALGGDEFAVLAGPLRRAPGVRHGERPRAKAAGDPYAAAGDILMRGQVLAIDGLSGSRLWVDATRPAAVAALRERLPDDSRLTVLCPDLEWAGRLATVSPAQAATLASRRNPVVLVRPAATGPGADLAPAGALLALTLPGCDVSRGLADIAQRPLAFVRV